MSQLVKHLKVSAIADGPDPNQVNPSDWNASHVFSGGALGGLLMRDTGDATYGASWLASVAAGSVLISNGVGAVPTWAASLTLGGNLTIGGLVTASGFGAHTFVAGGTGNQSLMVRNSLVGPGNYTTIYLGNDADPTLAALQVYSSTFTSGGPSQANGIGILCFGAGGISLANINAAAPMRFFTNGTERLRLMPTGELGINTTATLTGQLAIATDQTHTGIIIQNNTAGNALTMIGFVNSAGTASGTIAQTGASTVAYNTSSDARLKADAGRASDLAALRAVVVHDFTWTADGTRARGVFAQEAAAVFPRAITVGTDDRTDDGSLARPWMTDYSKFVPDLIVGWQQHDQRLDALETALARR